MKKSITSVINSRRPKRKGNKSILIDLEKNPKIGHWLARQAAKHNCSKTAYIEALIEKDRLDNGA